MTGPVVTGFDLYDTSRTVLKAIEQAAFDLGVALPPNRYITSGAAVHDCPQVVVTFSNVRTGLPPSGNIAVGVPGPATANGRVCAPSWSAVLVVDIVRDCAPMPSSKTGVTSKPALDEASKQVAQDFEVLKKAFAALTETLWANFDVTVATPPISGSFSVLTANMVVPLG